jgi:hypothetical protein
MNSLEIDVLCYDDAKCHKIFGGTIPSDQLQGVISHSDKRLFVVNTDTKDLPGEHWVCVYISEDDCEFFDSYANSPAIYPIINEGLRHLKITNKSEYRLQGNRKEVCGEYCVAYCLAKSRNIKINDFTRYWMEIENRDETIQQMIKGQLDEMKKWFETKEV